MRYAKTYYSTNGWTGPQNLSRFGQRINNLNNYTLGYEEFHFLEEIKELNLLYIPCFSHHRPGVYDTIELFYHIPGQPGPQIYGKVTGVVQLQENEVNEIRESLIKKEFPKKVKKIIEDSGTFPRHLIQPAFEAWQGNFNQNNIIAQGTDPRFILNVRYETIEIYPQTTIFDGVMNYAGILYGH